MTQVKLIACYPHNHRVSGLIDAIVLGASHQWDKEVEQCSDTVLFNACLHQDSLSYPLTGLYQPTDRVVIAKETIDNVLQFAPITNSYIITHSLGVTPSELLHYMAMFIQKGKPDLIVEVKTGAVSVSLGNLYQAVYTAVFNPQAIRIERDHNESNYLETYAPYKEITLPNGVIKKVPR